MNRFLGTTCFAISLVFCMITVVWTGVCGDFVSVLYDYCCVDRCLCSLIWFSLICNILCVFGTKQLYTWRGEVLPNLYLLTP